MAVCGDHHRSCGVSWLRCSSDGSWPVEDAGAGSADLGTPDGAGVGTKRRFRCAEPDCDVNTWSETSPQIAPRAVLTERARQRLADMGNIDGDSIAGAAAAFWVGWHTANQAVAVHTDPHINDPERLEGVTAIGVDEKRFLNATPTHCTIYTTQIVDLDFIGSSTSSRAALATCSTVGWRPVATTGAPGSGWRRLSFPRVAH